MLRTGDNLLRVQLVNDTPRQSIDLAYLDWIRLDYVQRLVAQSERIFFASPGAGAWRYSISGFTNRSVEVYDITDPLRVAYSSGSVVAGAFSFTDEQSDDRRYVAQAISQRLSPASITRATPANLLTPATGADYVIIAHTDFMDAIQPLGAWRAAQGLRVKVIDVQDVYDQFNYGRLAPQAIRDFLSHAYDNWAAPAPTYVLLVGDGNFDPRGYLPSSAPSFLPPWLASVDPDLGETAADNRYVTIVGNDVLPDMHIGRFPARTVADVTAMVAKTMRYEQVEIADDWNKNVLFVTDNLKDGGGAFYNFSDLVADGTISTAAGEVPLLPLDYAKTKLYLRENEPLCPDENPATTCRTNVVERLNEGALLVSYVGHGAKRYWAEEQVLTLGAMAQLSNEDRLPIMLPMTCLEGFFHEAEAERDAFGETIVRMANRGAVASWSPTGFGLVTGHDYLETGFFEAVFHNGVQQIGPATTYGKLHLLADAPAGKYEDLIDTFVLFGDPALQVRVLGSPPRATLPPEPENFVFLPSIAAE